MLETVRRFIEKEILLTPGCKVVVGVSGGADSMALLDLLTLLGYDCIAAHCNFHLRGEESQRDADFVRRWCKSVDIPYQSVDFDTNQYASDRKISIEMAARELRYDWFEIIRQQNLAEAIAVAHHKDDSVETVLLNLIRGTGIKGLAGISPKNGRVVRPLLCVTRNEIESYIAERGIPTVYDSTNSDDVYLRNALRIRVIPLLEEMNPSIKQTLYRTAQNITEAEKVYSDSINRQVAQVRDGDKINISELRKCPSPRSVLFEILTPLGYTPSVIEDIVESLDSHPGKQFMSNKYRVIKDRDSLIIVKLQERERSLYYIERETKQLDHPISLIINRLEAPVTIVANKFTLFADYDLLHYPLLLRRWLPGDWFIPLGMQGRKKLSDYFTDRKMNLHEKEQIWLILSGNDVVWIIGERMDDRYKVSDKTKRVLQINLTTESDK